MLDIITEHFLGVYEEGEDCKDLRARVINDKFEDEIGNYSMACEAINEIADEYFASGLKIGAKLVHEILS